MKKIIIPVALTIAVIGSTTFAATTLEIRQKIKDLQKERIELKAQVENRTITREEAKSIWKEKISDLKAAKDEVFSKKVERLEKKKDEFLKIHPTTTKRIQSRIDLIKDRRNRIKNIYNEVKTGVITRKEARNKIKLLKKEFKKETESLRNKFRDAVKKEKGEERIMVRKIKDEYKDEINEIKKELLLKKITKKEAMGKIKNIRVDKNKEFQKIKSEIKSKRESRKEIHDRYKNN